MYQMPVLMERSGVLSVSPRNNVTDIYGDVPVESGEAQTIEEVWEEYFADPSQWLDYRTYKVSPRLSLGLPVI